MPKTNPQYACSPVSGTVQGFFLAKNQDLCIIGRIMATKADTFAVIETGGKQYKVTKGQIITIEKLEDTFKEGDKVTFDKVLLTDDGTATAVGVPYITGVKVTAEFQEEGKAKKLRVLRFRSKSRYTRRYGHRQPYAKVKIISLA
jgi:large subunit ribosomal protein L21